MNTNLEKKISKKYLIIPALASISICCVVFIANVIIPNTKETLLSLDINPSIELSLNKQEKVVKCIAKNEDAKKIIGDMNLKNVEADIALNAIIGSLFQSGYLQKNTDENDILMSIDNKDKTKTKELEDKYTNVIKTTLKKSKISGTLLKQKDISNKNTKSLSEKYQISEGKASLIEKIIQKSPEANLDNLSTMNIKELVTYMSTNNLKLDDLDSEDIDVDDDVLDELNEIKEKEEDKIKEQQEKQQDRLKEQQQKLKEQLENNT